VAISKWNNFIF